MSLATLPFTTKLIGGLSLALALSFGANILQLRSAWVGEGKAQGAAERETLQAQNQQLEQANAVNTAISSRAKVDNTALLDQLGAIADRAQQTHTVYRAAAAKAPLAADCAPGQERMDAVNSGLGPVKERP